jgi:hypothetical protein
MSRRRGRAVLSWEMRLLAAANLRSIRARLALPAGEQTIRERRIRPPLGGVGDSPVGPGSHSSHGFEGEKKHESQTDGEREQHSQHEAKQHAHGEPLRLSVALGAGGSKELD